MIIQSTFKVIIEAPDCNAEFVFRKPKANKIFTLQKTDSEKDLRDYFYMLTEDLVSVDGLYHEDKKPVSVNEIKDLGLDFITLQAIIAAYNLAAYPKKEESDEKKSSSPESLSA